MGSIKIVIIGDGMVGKTSILSRYENWDVLSYKN